MQNLKDEKYMRIALMMARRGLGRTGENPAVGAVLVTTSEQGDEATIIARARTGNGGTPHAEPQAIAAAGQAAEGATLYVTLEPCNHHGKTPPCTEAIIKAKIARVVIASTDEDGRVKGEGIARLKAAGIAVTTGVLAKAADRMNAGHFLRQTHNRPFITLKVAVSKDGLILKGREKGAGKGPRWVTSERARRAGALLRLEADAILIGTKTALVDDPALTCRLNGCMKDSPRPVILDKDLKLPSTLQLFQKTQALTPLVVVSEQTSQDDLAAYQAARNVELNPVPLNTAGQIDLAQLARSLAAKGITRLLVEGGPRLEKSFINAGLVDELMVYRGEFEVGQEGILPFHDASLDEALATLGFTLQSQKRLRSNRIEQYSRPHYGE